MSGFRRAVVLALLLAGCGGRGVQNPPPTLVKSDAEWQAQLTREQYRILRLADTERPGTGALLHNHDTGTFSCAGCGTPLFASTTKFESGTGWPSFNDALPGAVALISDDTLGMHRVEVRCTKCGGHLGHVFDDGPAPTGKRYCMNSGALTFRPSKE